MSTINDSDTFLVQRGSNSYKQSASNLMSTILDTDWMLINRGSSSYKVSGSDVKEQLGGDGVRPGDTDMRKPWRGLWQNANGATASEAAGAGLASNPMGNLFNGKTGEENSAIPVFSGTKTWWITDEGANGLPISSFEFAYYNTINVASDIIIYRTSGDIINLFDIEDTQGNAGRAPGYHVFTHNELAPMNTLYGFSILPNNPTNDLLNAGDNYTWLDYIKIDGKILYHPLGSMSNP